MVNQHSDLKKQSQFAPARIGAKSFRKEGYENKSRPGHRENKPNQSQFRSPALAKGVGKREKSLAPANS
jgi:hypothetical protein